MGRGILHRFYIMKKILDKKLDELQSARGRCIELANFQMDAIKHIGDIRSESDIESICVSLSGLKKLLDKIGKIRFAEYGVDQLLREIEG